MPLKKQVVKKHVNKANSIIRAGWNLKSVWALRLMGHLASRIRMNDKNFKTYKILLTEILGTKYSGRDLKQLETEAKNIIRHPITFYENETRSVTYPLFSMCAIDAGTGYVELRFDAGLKPHLLELKSNFTSYELTELLTLQSVYSQRLFEVLMSYRYLSQGFIDLTLEELYETLSVPASFKTNFANFRRRVLDQAEKEIYGLSLKYCAKPLASGRGGKVSAVRFLFDEKLIRAELQKQASKCYHGKYDKGKLPCEPPEKIAKCEICVTQPWHVKERKPKSRQMEL